MATTGIVFFLVLASFLGASQAQLKAGCKIETLRACGDDFIVFGKRMHLDEPGQKFTEACALHKKQIACAIKFVDECLQHVPKTAGVVMSNAVKATIEGTCTEGTEQNKDYQASVKCLNSFGGKIHTCVRDFQASCERAILKAPKNEVIHHACCAYHDGYDCIAKTLAPCDSVGGKDFLLSIIENVFGNALDLLCGSHTKGSAECNALPKLPALRPKDRRITNFVEVLTEIAASIQRKN